jgi:hypothetical protein
MERAVGGEREQADEGLAVLHGDRNRRRHHVGRIAADDQIDFVHVEKLGVDAGHGRRIALVVVVDEFDRTPQQSAGGIDVVLPDLHRNQGRFAVRGERSALRHGKTDGDRIGGARRQGRGEGQRGPA